jgi:hypothetical protein
MPWGHPRQPSEAAVVQQSVPTAPEDLEGAFKVARGPLKRQPSASGVPPCPLGPKGTAPASGLQHVAKGIGQQSSNAAGSRSRAKGSPFPRDHPPPCPLQRFQRCH